MNTDELVEELWNKDIVECLDAIKEADEALETINRDMFRDISSIAVKVLDSGGDTTSVKNVLKSFEKRYKRGRSIKHMPGSYRSAKSVVLSAVRCGLYLMDGPGGYKGKTALEREIKARHKSTPKGRDKTAELGHTPEYYLDTASTLVDHAATSPVPGDRAVIRRYIESIENDIRNIRYSNGIR